MIKEIGKKNTARTKKDGLDDDFSAAPFCKKIALLRKEKHLTQKSIADGISNELASLNKLPITDRAVSKWETGDSLPDALQFLALCKLLEVNDVLKTFWGIKSAYDPFAGLNKLGKERAREYIDMLGAHPYFSFVAKPQMRARQIPLYDLPASAGTGVFLDGDAYTLIDIDETVPDSATLAVRLSGDSMQPRFNNGQIVYVHQQQELSNGDIGIFVLNGEAFCKKLDTEHGVRLISLNEKYAPIIIDESCELRVVGRVVG